MRADGNYPFTLVNGKYVTREKRNNSQVESWQGEATLYHTFKDDGELDVKGYYYQSRRGLPGSIILYNPATDERLWDKNGFAQLRYRKHFSDQWALQAQAKYNYSWDKYRDEGADYVDGVVTDYYTQQEYYGSGTLLYRPLPGLSFSLAQDIAFNTLDSTLPDCPFPLRFSSITALRAQYQWERVRLDAALVGTWITEHVESGSKPDDLKRLSPVFSINYRPWEEEFYIRLMYKNTFRTPTFNDLYYYRMGNRSLKPEIADELNVGITWSTSPNSWLASLSLTADGYFHRVKDKIVAFPTTYVWKMANFGKANASGLDVTLASRWNLTSDVKLNVNGSYSWQRAIDLSDPKSKSYKDQLPYTPQHTGNASAVLELPWCSVGYTLIGVGKRYYLSQNLPENKIDGYLEHSASLTRKFSFKGWSLFLQADLLNLTNKQYEVIKYYPMPGRSWKLSATVEF